MPTCKLVPLGAALAVALAKVRHLQLCARQQGGDLHETTLRESELQQTARCDAVSAAALAAATLENIQVAATRL